MASVWQNIVRDERGDDLLEMMLVFAVVTILGIRAFLALTGYPQLGGDGLHIAHMLWGGLAMLISIALLLTFWNPAMRNAAAWIGGIGFGFFIDELGKFITSDNDYFFQPTIALLYVLFILLFLIVRVIRSKPLTEAEVSANRGIIAAMSASDETGHVVRLYTQIQNRFQNAYARLVTTRWFVLVLSVVFVVAAIVQAITIVALVTGHSGSSPPDQHIPVLQEAASAVSAVLILVGVLRLRGSRLSAYRWFQRSALVNILVTQVFMFYFSELAALGGLFVQILIYLALRILIAREEELVRSP